MALEGNLSSFGLSEILQLIAVQQKTGMLSLATDDESAVMYFREGQIISTRDRRRRAGGDPFKDYLTRYGVIGQDELIKVEHISAKSKLDFTDILASEGIFTEEELVKHWRMQIQESMHHVLTWEQCSYKFVSSDEIVSGIKVVAEFNIESMLMESMRRIDEYPRMLEIFPNKDATVERTDLAPSQDDKDMTSNAWHIHCLLTKPRTIRDVISRGKIPAFDVYEALKSLLDKELISVEEQSVASPSEGEAPRARTKTRKKRGNPLPVVFALAVLGGSAFVGLAEPIRDALRGTASFLWEVPSDEHARTRLEYRLHWAIESYRASRGFYPNSLDALEKSGLVTAALLGRAERMDFKYRLTGNRTAYTLL